MILYPSGQAIDLVNAVGDNSYYDGETIVRHVNPSTVLVSSEADLSTEEMSDLAPSSIAYTAGFANIWQKAVNGTWVEVR